MGRNDFFLDTGIIFGQFDTNDDFHPGSMKHLGKYPYNDHNYYAVKRLALIEVRSVQRNKRTRPGNEKYRKGATIQAARMKIRVESLFSLNKVKDIDYKAVHASFNELYNNIFSFLESNKKDDNPKDRDADILSNAFIWDKDIPELYNPCFVTTDGGDFSTNETGLKCIANDCLKNKTRLDFCLIPARKHAS